MARIRSVHPDICASQTLAVLSAELERTFVRLWTHCDDEGRCEDRPRLIKAGIYPEHDDVTWQRIDQELDDLQAAGLIVRYQADGKGYVQVCSWSEYQHPQKKRASKFPPPPDQDPDGSRTSTRPLRDTYISGVSGVDDTSHPNDVHANGPRQHGPRTPPRNPRSEAGTRTVRDTYANGKGLENGEGEGEGVEDIRAATPATSLALVPGHRSSPTATAPNTDFDAWWTLYPRKVAKAAARKAWKTARGHATWDQLTNGLRASIDAWEREQRPIDKIPHAATWLNGRRWEDQPATGPLARSEPKGFSSIRAVLEAGGHS